MKLKPRRLTLALTAVLLLEPTTACAPPAGKVRGDRDGRGVAGDGLAPVAEPAPVVGQVSRTAGGEEEEASVVSLRTDVRTLPKAEQRIFRALVAAGRALPKGEGAATGEAGTAAAGHLQTASRAAREAGQERQALYLEAATRALQGDGEGVGEELNRLRPPEPAETLSPLIVTVGQQRDRVGEPPTFHLQLGWEDAASAPWVRAYLDGLNAFEASLPWREAGLEVPPPPGPKRDRIAVADLALRSGALAAATASSTFLPFERGLWPTHGRTFLFWKNLLAERWYPDSIAPAIPLILAPVHRPLASREGHLRFYATRFSTYQLGPQAAPGPDGPSDLAERFGELHNPLIIAKADLLATLAQDWLAGQGAVEPRAADETLVMLVVMSFRALADARRGEAPPPHEPASALILNFLRERGALAPTGDGWALDLAALRRGVRELAGTLLGLHARGDLEGARRLFAASGQVGPELAPTLAALAALPGGRSRVAYDIVGLDG